MNNIGLHTCHSSIYLYRILYTLRHLLNQNKHWKHLVSIFASHSVYHGSLIRHSMVWKRMTTLMGTSPKSSSFNTSYTRYLRNKIYLRPGTKRASTIFLEGRKGPPENSALIAPALIEKALITSNHFLQSMLLLMTTIL